MSPRIELEFDGEIIEWRGPSPFHFVPVPEDIAEIIHDVASAVSYGWGVIPATVRIGNTDYTTSLFPRNGGYLVPVKDAVRKPERLAIGDSVNVHLSIDMSKA
jgi:Domain of unknown function (DUF1905)